MKKYCEYMDGVSVSDTLHQRLLSLKPSRKRSVWAKYGTIAAALLLVVGLGAWGIRQGMHTGRDLPLYFTPDANAEPGVPDVDLPEITNIAQPDIAPEEPGDAAEPGMKTIGGYEVRGEGSGPDTVVTYYVLPRIEYGMAEELLQLSLDWDVPAGAVKKELTRDEINALMGGAGAVSDHLDWDGYELSGWAAWYEDGSFWGAYLYGYIGPLDHFEFAVTANSLPPTCIAYPESVEQEIWGIAVTADGHDSVAGPDGGVDASSRRVSFMKGGYGYRFDLTGVSRALTEERVSRLVRWFANEELGAVSSDGAELAHPWEADPNYSIGEPNWEDDTAMTQPRSPDADSSAFDPLEAADPFYNAP